MYTGEHSPEESCKSYIKELKKLETQNNIPRFDLIVWAWVRMAILHPYFQNLFY